MRARPRPERRRYPRHVADEGWLSEESTDARARLRHRRVWIVDPLDGTRELLEHVPPWTVSIGLAEDGAAVAGGVYNPTTGELFLGARETGTTLNGEPVRVSTRDGLEGALVLRTAGRCASVPRSSRTRCSARRVAPAPGAAPAPVVSRPARRSA
ncbi:MAG: hypothetical protein FJ027_20415 [Candidatus Rokubacteria bacterium]|nr:hypothetical protein [Candidatus Rokubacteria bacterium]